MKARIWGVMLSRPAPPKPIFEEEVPIPDGMTPHRQSGVPARAFAALIIGNVALACGPWLVRLADVGPVASGFWRLTLAVPFLLLIAWRSEAGQERPGLPVLGLLLLAGVMFALDLGSWHAGILRTKLANASLFGNVSSFFFAVYGFVVARRLPHRRQAVALLLALLGVGLLLGRSYDLSAKDLAGDLLCMLAAIFYVVYMIAIDRVRGRLGNWTTLVTATIVAAITLLPLALLIEGDVWPHRWTPLLVLAIGSQVVGQGLLIYTIRLLPPVVVGLGQLSQPMVGAAIGWIVFQEHLTLPDIIGAIAIATALILVRKS